MTSNDHMILKKIAFAVLVPFLADFKASIEMFLAQKLAKIGQWHNCKTATLKIKMGFFWDGVSKNITSKNVALLSEKVTGTEEEPFYERETLFRC